MAACLEYGEKRVKDCTETADRGFSECEGWTAWLCVVWVWSANVVCVAWTVTVTTICVLWDVATTVLGAVVVTLESTLGWLASAFAFVIEMVEAIPVLGTFIRWARNIGTWLAWSILSLADFVFGWAGIRPEKKLRVCTVILSDGDGKVADPAYAVALLQYAADLYKRDANVRIIPSRPFKYVTGFQGPETVDQTWVQVDASVSDTDLLKPGCNAAGVGGEWWLGGSKFQLKMSSFCFFGAWRRTSGYGAPVTCFIVRAVQGFGGCALWITDFAAINAGSVPPLRLNVLAHEVGHASNLWHVCVDDDRTNLMASPAGCPTVDTPAGPVSSATQRPDFVNSHMEEWQVMLVRASKHVTYF
jgi:hypothetical protein